MHFLAASQAKSEVSPGLLVMHKKLSSFQISEKDTAAILMPQSVQTYTRSQKAAHLIIFCSLAPAEILPSNCAEMPQRLPP